MLYKYDFAWALVDEDTLCKQAIRDAPIPFAFVEKYLYVCASCTPGTPVIV